VSVGSSREDDPIRPRSPYSASKAAGDLLVQAYHATYGLPTIITRASNNFGPYQYPEKIIPLFVTNAIDDESLPLYGDGEQIRDWLYVEDHCEAISLAEARSSDPELSLPRTRPSKIKTVLLATDRRALFTATLEEGTPVTVGRSLRLAVNPARFHYFDLETGARLDTAGFDTMAQLV